MMSMHCIYCGEVADIDPLVWVSKDPADEDEKTRHRKFCEKHEQCGEGAVGGMMVIPDRKRE